MPGLYERLVGTVGACSMRGLYKRLVGTDVVGPDVIARYIERVVR